MPTLCVKRTGKSCIEHQTLIDVRDMGDVITSNKSQPDRRMVEDAMQALRNRLQYIETVFPEVK